MQLSGSHARRGVAIAVLAALALSFGSDARADEASGTWTGELTLRGNYYWETSTRVVAPEGGIRLVSPDGTSLHADYLVDAITSASLAAGVQSDIRFTEVRNQVSLGFGRELDLGDAQLRVDASGRVSHEPDYLATGGTLSAVLAWNQRATTLGLTLGYIHDDVGQVVRGAARMDPSGRDLSDRGRVGQLEGFSGSLSFSQALSPEITLSVGYDFVHNWGFLQNAYRTQMVGGVFRPETHPDQRTRHAGSARLAFFLPWTRTAIHVLYRAYIDDWDIGAITPEARLYQEVGDHVTLRLRYRFFAQTAAFFAPPSAGYSDSDVFITADPKMTAFHSHLVGAYARLELGFLGGGELAFLEESSIDLSFDYWTQTSRFGDGILAQAGLTIPF